MNTTQDIIKRKILEFKHNDTTFQVKVVYDTSTFGYGSLSFWQMTLFQVDYEPLITPITYKYEQNRRWLNQIPKFRIHSFYCSTRRREIENQTNIYPLVKEQTIYLYFNQIAIAKYKLQVDNFNYIIQKKFQYSLEELREQKRVLKQKLKSEIIDNIEYQKLYTPIRKLKDEIELHMFSVCHKYHNRYFESDKLKQIYRAV